MLHHQGDNHREDSDHHIEHQDAAHLLEIFPTVEIEVDGEEHDEDDHEQRLSGNRRGDLIGRGTASLHLSLKTAQYTEGVLIHDLSTVHNLLSAHHDTAGNGDTA